MTCNKFNNINQKVPIAGYYDNYMNVIGTASIKLINASSNTVTVYIDSNIINLRPYYIGDYFKVNATSSNVVIKNKHKTIINTDLLLDGGGIYTFIIIGNEYLLLDDDISCPNNTIRVRFVHGAQSFGTVDVALGNYQFNDIMYQDSNVLEIDETKTKLTISPYAFTPVNLYFKRSGIYTIILINKNGNLSILNTDSSYCVGK